MTPYFEVERPISEGYCSDNNCPCGYPGELIPRGKGYIVISKDVVKFRRYARSIKDAKREIRRLQSRGNSMGMNIMFADGGAGSINPILCCSKSQLLKGLNREVAASDAKHWWKTGMLPLRATPKAGVKVADKQSDEELFKIGNITIPNGILIILLICLLMISIFTLLFSPHIKSTGWQTFVKIAAWCIGLLSLLRIEIQVMNLVKNKLAAFPRIYIRGFIILTSFTLLILFFWFVFVWNKNIDTQGWLQVIKFIKWGLGILTFLWFVNINDTYKEIW